MAHISPLTIFSPSVARQQLAAAKDWNYVDNWLNTKFNGKTSPPFERNSETLKALLALAALNESADEERELSGGVDAKALLELQSNDVEDPNAHILNALGGALTREGHTSLETLSSLSVTTSQNLQVPESLARNISVLQGTSYDIDQASNRVSLLHKHLISELERINLIIEELQRNIYQAPSGLTEQTVYYQRKTKLLAAKIPELRDRMTTLAASADSSKLKIEDVRLEEDKFRDTMAAAKDLEAQVKAYHGLPQDTDLARLELGSLSIELRDLTRQRDGLFEGLVERESPKKRA